MKGINSTKYKNINLTRSVLEYDGFLVVQSQMTLYTKKFIEKKRDFLQYQATHPLHTVIIFDSHIIIKCILVFYRFNQSHDGLI